MLYGSETWVMTPHIGRFLGVSHHRVARRLMGRQPRRRQVGGCVYPLMSDTMAEAGSQEVDNYISLRHNTITQFIMTRPIMDLCLAMDQRKDSRVENWW